VLSGVIDVTSLRTGKNIKTLLKTFKNLKKSKNLKIKKNNVRGFFRPCKVHNLNAIYEHNRKYNSFTYWSQASRRRDERFEHKSPEPTITGCKHEYCNCWTPNQRKGMCISSDVVRFGLYCQ